MLWRLVTLNHVVLNLPWDKKIHLRKYSDEPERGRGERQQFTKLGKKYQHVLLGSERIRATKLDPQHYGCLPLPVPRAGYAPSTLLLPDTQPRSYIIGVWLYETFIMIETVINRYLAVKTWERLNKLLIMIFTQTQWLAINLKLLASTKYWGRQTIGVNII